MYVLQVQGIIIFAIVLCFGFQSTRKAYSCSSSEFVCFGGDVCVSGSAPIPSIGMYVSVSLLSFSSCQGSLWTYFHYNCFTAMYDFFFASASAVSIEFPICLPIAE